MSAQGKIEYYETESGWEWRFIAANGEVLAHSGEVFSSKQAVLKSIETTTEYFINYDKFGLLVEVDYKNGEEK